MSAVDVLATLRDHRATCGQQGCEWCEELDGVIAAVAELVEAARTVNRVADWCTGDGSVFDRLNAALRRMEGKA